MDGCKGRHNPGIWPYEARCILSNDHKGDHEDRHGNTWPKSHEEAWIAHARRMAKIYGKHNMPKRADEWRAMAEAVESELLAA